MHEQHEAAGTHRPHEWDGISVQEGRVPAWPHLIFLATVLFSAGYFLFFHANSESWTVVDTWQATRVSEFRRVFGDVGELVADESTIQRMRADNRFMEIAQVIFAGNCAQCHEKDGGGKDGSGVNLTDDSYKNVRRLEDFFTIITRGANGQAMPAWENRLSQNERVIVAAYVANLRGTTPAKAKAAEGNPVPPWPVPGSVAR